MEEKRVSFRLSDREHTYVAQTSYGELLVGEVGFRRDEHPRVYTNIKIDVEVVGKDISPKAVEDAVKLSLEKYCSVNAMLKNYVNIEVQWKVLNSNS
ncbi:OsmC family protein [Thermocrinis sp.]|uniref:OsmC family protein n=1 Tax=Thermocrinis sp. TaxID=2024383 RepID=UPI002FDCE2C8